MIKDLSPRELQILRIMAEDKTAKQIAFMLGISEDMVNTHERHIREKLCVNTNPGAIHKAHCLHLISLFYSD